MFKHPVKRASYNSLAPCDVIEFQKSQIILYLFFLKTYFNFIFIIIIVIVVVIIGGGGGGGVGVCVCVCLGKWSAGAHAGQS